MFCTDYYVRTRLCVFAEVWIISFWKEKQSTLSIWGPKQIFSPFTTLFQFLQSTHYWYLSFFYFSTYKFDIKFKIYAMVEDMICYNNDLGFFSLLLFLQFCISNINLALDTPNYEIIIKNSNIFFLSYYDVLCQAIKIELRTQLLHGE